MKRTAKRIALFGLMAGTAVVSTGCATPAYSPAERDRMIARTWEYDAKQAVDDFDHVLLLRPPSRMTVWNVR